MYLLKRIGLFLLFPCLLKAQTTGAFQNGGQQVPGDNKKQTALDSLIGYQAFKFIQNPQNCGISIGVAINGVNYFYNYGETRRNTKAAATQNTIYEIGSVSATFCGILLAKAVAENKLKLSDDIRKYIPRTYPDLMFDKTVIQLQHLANHTSGLPAIPENMEQQAGYDPLNPYRNYDRQKIYDYLTAVHLSSEPGTVCEYSSLGITLLGIILETVYQKPFEDLVLEKICMPNQMGNTGILLSKAQSGALASGYNQNGEPTPAWELGEFDAAGGLRSTTTDMLKYLNFNLEEKDGAVKLSHQPTFSGRQTLGLGWFIKKTKQGNTFTWHNGATFGFSSFCGFIKEKNCSLVILANSATSLDYIGIAILNHLQQ